jgi:hypothetical protein
MVDGVRRYAEDVRARQYPEPDHTYTMAPDEAARLRSELGSRTPTARRDVLG